MPRFLLLFLIALSLSVPVSAQHGKTKPDPVKQAAWLRAAADSLRSAESERWQVLSVQEQDLPEGKRLSYHLNGKGCLRVDANRFICFISTPADTDPEVGDLTLARDDRGRMALHRAHVCGGILHFVGPAGKPVRRLSDFTRWFRSDTNTLSWEAYKP